MSILGSIFNCGTAPGKTLVSGDVMVSRCQFFLFRGRVQFIWCFICYIPWSKNVIDAGEKFSVLGLYKALELYRISAEWISAAVLLILVLVGIFPIVFGSFMGIFSPQIV